MMSDVGSNPVITVHNTCEPGVYDKETDMKWYDWSVFISTDPETLVNKIEYVTYHLHPSFRKMNHDVTIRGSGGKHFILHSKGWGEFIIRADIHMQDKKKVTIEHYLTLTRNSQTHYEFAT